MRTSVRSEAGCPSSGAVCRNPVAGRAAAHAESPSTSPSSTGVSSMPAATICLIENPAPMPRPAVPCAGAALPPPAGPPGASGGAEPPPSDRPPADSDARPSRTSPADELSDWLAAGAAAAQTAAPARTAARTGARQRRDGSGVRCSLIGCSRAAAGAAAPRGSWRRRHPRPTPASAPPRSAAALPTAPSAPRRSPGGRPTRRRD